MTLRYNSRLDRLGMLIIRYYHAFYLFMYIRKMPDTPQANAVFHELILYDVQDMHE